MFQKILCCVDFSEPSLGALVGALRIAHQDGSRLSLANVLDPSRLSAQEAASESEYRMGRLKDLVDDKIREYFPATGKDFRRQIDVVSLSGAPAAELLRFIRSDKPDLVVMATHGRSGLSHALLGSVAERVLRHSTAPVLLVRSPADWPPKQVLIPIDFSDAKEDSAMLVAQLGAKSLELLHVLGLPDLLILPDGQPASLIRDEKALREEAIGQLQKLRSQHPSLKDASVHVSIGPAGEEICRRAGEGGFDLILMPTEGRSGISRFFVGSVAERVARSAPCNVLTFTTAKALAVRREALSQI
ncbi:MAG TPA: universal stress protein [bacterium]|nr:universal stress protein [bacterium]